MHNEEPQWLQQMEPIFEILNDGVLILTDESHRILFVNTVFEEMTGIPRGEIIGRDPRQLIHGAEDYARVHAFQQKTREKGRGREEFLPVHEGRRATARGGQCAHNPWARGRAFRDRDLDRYFGTETY